MKDKLKIFLYKFLNAKLAVRISVSVVALLLFFGLFWQFIYSDISKKKLELIEEIDSLESRIISQQGIAKNLNKYDQEVKDLDVKLANLLRELPDQKEVEGFLNSISILATDTGLEVLQFTPRGETKEEFFANLPVYMELEGTFHQLVTFFDEVAHLPRIVNINNIGIRTLNENPNEVIIRATCTATTFRYLDAPVSVFQTQETNNVRRRR